MEFVLLKQLSLTQHHCKIRVRVSRIWESTTPLNKNNILSLDCLLIDDEEYAMQATVRKYDAEHFRSVLSEDVLGSVTSIAPLSHTYVAQELTAIRKLEIRDIDDQVMSVTLWDKFALDFDDDLLKQKEVNGPVAIVLASMTGAKYTCKAKLLTVDTTYGWWYKACYDCKGAVKDYGENFWCGQCGKNERAPIPWYKLNTVVEDETGSADFIIFGKVAQDLIHIPAQQLAIATNSDRFVLPPIVKNIIGHSYIFQILPDNRRSSMNLTSFRVAKIFSTDLEVKGKKKEHTDSVQEIEEDVVESSIAVKENDDADEEISPTQLLQSTSQSSAKIFNSRKRKRTFR
ncbi:hypothetical protein ACMD2_05465 [Ananas comosus]|uniref:Replication factor A C-terminal domain-containing protein n=1 Tax=Ananas comosus TaxID=4615 RepID=A0A199W5R1_ANACO|nr:hypothetical protein ACMD2_05465 [Ananas comosus]